MSEMQKYKEKTFLSLLRNRVFRETGPSKVLKLGKGSARSRVHFALFIKKTDHMIYDICW